MNILQPLVQKRVTAICTFCKLLIRKKNIALLNNDIQDVELLLLLLLLVSDDSHDDDVIRALLYHKILYKIFCRVIYSSLLSFEPQFCFLLLDFPH